MLLCVKADDALWLADLGSGAGVEEPIPLIDGAVVDQDGWSYEMHRDGHGWWWLSALTAHGPSDLYAFTLVPHHRVDYEVANSTHPCSPFVGRPVVMRTAGGARHNLVGRELTTTRLNGSRHQRMLAAGELGDVLGEVFGVALPPDDLVRLTAETEKGK